MFLDLSKKPQKKVPQMLESRKNVRIFVQFFFFFERERARERQREREREERETEMASGGLVMHLNTCRHES